MNGRRGIIRCLAACALAFPLSAFAQEAGKIPRIGILSSESPTEAIHATRLGALRQGLLEHGYEDGKNISFESRYANGQYSLLPDLAAALVRLDVHIIVAVGIKAAVAAKNATSKIPVILPATTADVVSLGLASSLARPGGNFTGSTSFGPEIMAKRMELLNEIMPRATRMAFLFNPSNPSIGPTLRTMEVTAKSRNVTLSAVKARVPADFAGAFNELAKNRIDVLILQGDTLFTINPRQLAQLALKHRFAAAGAVEFAHAGGLLGYAPNVAEQYRAPQRT
ncbi:MAG: ABC transporter substrate-binding protein [Betaproteobacteria bacterium]